jgi:hypothetical protein
MSERRTPVAVACIVIAGLGLAQLWIERSVAAQAKPGVQAPRFEVDPLWPKPLPNHWVLGNAIGVWVDERITSGSSTAARTR